MNKDPHNLSALITGDVVFNSEETQIGKKLLCRYVRNVIRHRCGSEDAGLQWMTYLVTFLRVPSGEMQCRVEMDADAEQACFTVGSGSGARAAFRDAMSKARWVKKDIPVNESA